MIRIFSILLMLLFLNNPDKLLAGDIWVKDVYSLASSLTVFSGNRGVDYKVKIKLLDEFNNLTEVHLLSEEYNLLITGIRENDSNDILFEGVMDGEWKLITKDNISN